MHRAEALFVMLGGACAVPASAVGFGIPEVGVRRTAMVRRSGGDALSPDRWLRRRARGRARLRRKLGCVTIADASDVVTAGAPGDSTHLLRALLAEASGLLTYCAVRDPQAIASLWARAPGDRVALSIGGTLDPASSPPVPVEGTLVSKHDRRGFGKTVALAVDHLRIVITEGPAMVMRPAFYTDLGLSIWKADIVVVKNFFPFLIFFLPYSRKTLYARTHGRSDFDAAFELTSDGPMHPRDVVEDWRERDRARRGVDHPPGQPPSPDAEPGVAPVADPDATPAGMTVN